MELKFVHYWNCIEFQIAGHRFSIFYHSIFDCPEEIPGFYFVNAKFRPLRTCFPS